MKYAYAVDAADFFTFLGYRLGCQQTNTGGKTKTYRCQSCTNTFTAYDRPIVPLHYTNK